MHANILLHVNKYVNCGIHYRRCHKKLRYKKWLLMKKYSTERHKNGKIKTVTLHMPVGQTASSMEIPERKKKIKITFFTKTKAHASKKKL